MATVLIRNISGTLQRMQASDQSTVQVPVNYYGKVEQKFLFSYNAAAIVVYSGESPSAPGAPVSNPTIPDVTPSPPPPPNQPPVVLSNTIPSKGSKDGSAGSKEDVSRSDHSHPLPTANEVGAANINHTHAMGQITGLSDALQGKANSQHSHAPDAIEGLSDRLNAQDEKLLDTANKSLSNVDNIAFKAKADAAGVGGTIVVTDPNTPQIDFYNDIPKVGDRTGLPGESTQVSRGDHQHPLPTPSAINAADKQHSHSVSDVNGLSDALANTADKNLTNVSDADFKSKAQSAGVTSGAGGTGLGSSTPKALGTASPGTSNVAAHEDHVHPMPSAGDVGAATASHTHAVGSITGLTTALEAKAPVAHTHEIANINGLQAALDAAGTGGSSSGTVLLVTDYTGMVGGPIEGPMNTSTAVSETRTYQTWHHIKDGTWARPRLYYANRAGSANGQLVKGPATITIKCSIRNGTRTVPVYFDPNDSRVSADGRTVTLQPGQDIWSEPAPCRLAIPGFHVRTRISGTYYPATAWVISDLNEGYQTADFVDTVGAVTSGWVGGSGRVNPSMIEAEPAAVFTPKPRVVITGSSSASGHADVPEAPDFHYGYLARLVGNAGMHYARCGVSGDTLYNFSTLDWTTRRKILLAGNPHYVIQQAGSNDITGNASLATMQALVKDAVARVYGLGLLTVLVTITPNTSASSAANDVRVQYNQWLRDNWSNSSVLPGVYDLLDVASVTDDKITSGATWKSSDWHNGDGLHTSQYAAQQIAAILGPQVNAWALPS